MVKEWRLSVRNAAGWVLLIPFLLLSLISSAAMPARAADGTMVLILCTGDGPVETMLDLATGQPVEKAPAKAGDHCAWACGQMTLADLAPPAMTLGVAASRRAEPPAPLPSLALSHAKGLPPATGPPASA
jgi:hypothetical protein